MKRDELGDLVAFLAVVEAGGFTRAAARLGTSQSALSHTIQRLEARLGVRLLHRTTRRVAPTEAGETLAAALRPGFDGISDAVATVQGQRDRVTDAALAGTVASGEQVHRARHGDIDGASAEEVLDVLRRGPIHEDPVHLHGPFGGGEGG